MKRFMLIAIAALYFFSLAQPVFAADKYSENNKKVADFISDTFKFPYVLIGSFVKQDHQEVAEEMDYKGHRTLGEALKKK